MTREMAEMSYIQQRYAVGEEHDSPKLGWTDLAEDWRL
jgi:hypothetical protein